MANDQFLIVKGRAGLGNRLLCALTGMLYARMTRRRLIIDWRDATYSNDASNAFPRFFRCDCCGSTDQIPFTDSIRPAVWGNRLHMSAGELQMNFFPQSIRKLESWRQFSFDMSRLDYSEEVLVMWSYVDQIDELRKHFHGDFRELRGKSTRAILTGLLRDNLVLHPGIRRRVDAFKSDWAIQKQIGVHIRYLDKRSRLKPIQRRLDALTTKEPGARIFLATDNSRIESNMKQRYARVISTPKWYPASGNSMHGNPGCPDRLENGVEALIDMYLLAECDYLISDESSSFPYISALLTDLPAGRRFNVARGQMLPPRLRRRVWLLLRRLQQRHLLPDFLHNPIPTTRKAEPPHA